jgi:exocyst complex component 8
MAALAQDMFIGRERFATLLMMKLIEPVILFISDQSFWEEIEEGPHPLGPCGLQQVIKKF